MRKILTLLLISFFHIAEAYSQNISKPEATPAFPTAEGFGRYATGGRGGRAIHVTTLDDGHHEGTLRYALEQEGPRTIIFDVSGTIHLKKPLRIESPDVTIAGQTAPGDGICVADFPVLLQADNIICRYMRFRLGNKHVNRHEGDGLGGCDHHNIIVDHCSISWSIDECLSIYGNFNSTVQWCIVSQSLVNAGHSKGEHGYGGNWGGSGASYHHNLMAHHTSRMPRLGPRMTTQEDERMDLRNNVFYNWAGAGCYGGEGMTVNIVNNYYKPGPETDKAEERVRWRIAAPNIRTSQYCRRRVMPDGRVRGNGWLKMWHKWGHFYLAGNVNPDYPKVTQDNWTYGLLQQLDTIGNDGTCTAVTRDTIRLMKPMAYEAVTTESAEEAYEKVLAHAGASLHRDSHDMKIVNDVRNRTASPGFINTPEDNGPDAWPKLKSLPAPSDTDRDGMPDAWERRNGLNPKDARDALNITESGYSNLELYINSLVNE